MTNESDTPRTDDAEADAVTGEPTGLVAAGTMRGMEAQLLAANERVKELENKLRRIVNADGMSFYQGTVKHGVITQGAIAAARAALTKGGSNE